MTMPPSEREDAEALLQEPWTQAPRWRPESPFADDGAPFRAPREASPRSVVVVSHSPFVNEIGDRLVAADPVTHAVAELLAELKDEEFDLAVHDLVHELSGMAAARNVGETDELRSLEARVERALEDRLAPLATSYENQMDELAEQLAPLDMGSMTEAELDAVLERTAPPPSVLGPNFEFFLKKLWDKTKKAVKGAVNFVKKGVSAVSSLALKPVFAALRKLVRPLLKKVLALTMDKIPEKYRPMAEKVAAQLGAKSGRKPSSPAATSPAGAPLADGAGTAAAEPSGGAAGAPAADAAATSEPTAAAVSEIQDELDGRFAELLLASSDIERETALAQQEAEARRPALDPVGELERGRRRFVRAVAQLRQGESPAPAVEQFLPIVVSALKLGLKLIGRKRVITFLGKMLGNLVAPIVGKDVATPLATMFADMGLKLLGFELSAGEQEEATGQALAHTLEETIRRVAALPAYVLDNELLLESHVLEAFETAAATSFPPALIKQELREAPGVDAMWVQVPARGRSYYRKFTHRFEIELTRPVAESIASFHGRTLEAVLRDVQQVSFPLQARVHLFELRPGGRLAHIAGEEQLQGLTPATSAQLLHPLTRHAATALLHHPRLGTAFGAAPHPLDPSVGQRYYHLELVRSEHEGPRGLLGALRPSHLSAHVDFGRGEIRVRLYVAEAAAQPIASELRKSRRGAVLVHRLRQLFAADLNRLASAHNHGILRIHSDGNGATDRSLAAVAKDGQRAAVRRELGAKIVEWTLTRLADHAQQKADEFVHATQAPDLGVTLRLAFQHPPRLPALRRLLAGGAATADDRWPPDETPRATLDIWAGHRPE
jgi:hypothetical protein